MVGVATPESERTAILRCLLEVQFSMLDAAFVSMHRLNLAMTEGDHGLTCQRYCDALSEAVSYRGPSWRFFFGNEIEKFPSVRNIAYLTINIQSWVKHTLMGKRGASLYV